MRRRDPHLNADRRKAVLQAASSCFVRRGFHATSMKDVCAEAAMSPGTLYHYYPSKAAIVADIIDAERASTAEILARLEGSDDILAGLLTALREIMDAVTEQDLLLHAEITAEILRDADLRDRARRNEVEAAQRLGARIAGAQQAGRLSPAVAPDAVAVAVGALFDGMLWRATLHGRAHLRAELPDLEASLARLLGIEPAR